MTLTELSYELKKITQGESPDELDEVASIVNMALSRLYSDLRPTSVYRFYQKEILPITTPRSFHKVGGLDVTLPISGRAYGMHLSGKGEYTVKVGDASETYEFDTAGQFFSGYIDDVGEITFSGELSYDVYSLSFYDEISSDNIEEIPSGLPKRYRLFDMIDDLAYPTALPTDGTGVIIDGAEYIGCELFIPPDYAGDVVIKYAKRPERVSFASADKDISVEYPRVGALIHLCAYFALLEGERELADRHLDAYLASLDTSKIEKAEKEETVIQQSGEYRIEDGWA